MKSIKIVGLCLAAVLAFSALAAASASAEPTFKLCVKAEKEPKGSEHKYNGGFKDKGCTEAEAGGKYALNAIPRGTEYAGKSKTTRIGFKNKEGKAVTVTCKKDALALVTASANSFGGALTLEKCEKAKKEPCTVTPGLYNVPAVSFSAAEKAPFGIVFFTETVVKCGSEEAELGGWLAGNAETTSKGLTISFNLSGGGQQEHKDFFYEGKDWATTGEPPYLINLETGEEATFESKEEIAAKGLQIDG